MHFLKITYLLRKEIKKKASKLQFGTWLMGKYVCVLRTKFSIYPINAFKNFVYFQEFLDGDDDELVQLAKSILIYPESGVLALPLFNPNKSCVDNFLSLYSTLTSSVGKYSANTVLALFSKVSHDKYSRLWLIGTHQF